MLFEKYENFRLKMINVKPFKGKYNFITQNFQKNIFSTINKNITLNENKKSV